jgi:CRP/FNR family transcriptional regulator, cyclic AMP receptor protein
VATTSEIVEHMEKVPIFSGCSKKELQTIAKQVREIEHEAGHVIATEGEPGAGLFVIDEGEADVTIGGRKVNHMKAGDFFGEMALLDGGPRTATVTATTDIKLYALTEWVFRGLLAEHPGIAMQTLETMASRLRRATKAASA